MFWTIFYSINCFITNIKTYWLRHIVHYSGEWADSHERELSNKLLIIVYRV